MKRRKFWLLFWPLALILLLSGCGKEEETPLPEWNWEENRYTARYQLLSEGERLRFAGIWGDRIWYIDNCPAGLYDRYQSFKTILRFDPDSGEETPLEAFTELQYEQNHFSSRVGRSDYDLFQLAEAPDGTLWVLAGNRNHSSMNDEGKAALLRLDSEGNVAMEIPLEISAGQYSDWATDLFCDGAGRCVLLDGNTILIFDDQGRPLGKIAGKTDQLIPLSGGRLAALSISVDETQWTVSPVNLDAFRLEPGITIHAARRQLAYCGFYAGEGDYDFLCSDGLSLYGYRLGQEDPVGEYILTWLNCDIEGSGLLALGQQGEDFLCAVKQENGVELVRLQPRPEGGDPPRVVTLGCRELPNSLEKAVCRFNRKNTGVRVMIRDYGAVAARAGAAVTIDRMTADFLAGKTVDILCTDGMDTQSLIDRGFLEDLWPYIDSDSELGGREALVTPLFDALTREGKLYQISSFFSCRTALARTELVGETPGWTVEEFFRVYRSMEDCRSIVFGLSNDRWQALDAMIPMCAENFINRKNWTSSFDSPEFAALLEYTAAFPDQIPSASLEEYIDWGPEGRQLLAERWIFDPRSIFSAADDFGTTRLTTIGYPGVAGNGSSFLLETPLSMWAGSRHKEDAWTFLRFLLTPEGQQQPNSYYIKGMPTNRAAYDALMHSLEQPAGSHIVSRSWTAENTADFWDFLSGITVVEQNDQAVAAIIRDEAARYYDGIQTAEEAGKAVQKRVNLYLGERKG